MGFAPDLKTNDEAVEIIIAAIEKAGYRPGDDISICVDSATSEMWNDGRYEFFKSGGIDQFRRNDHALEDINRPLALIGPAGDTQCPGNFARQRAGSQSIRQRAGSSAFGGAGSGH